MRATTEPILGSNNMIKRLNRFILGIRLRPTGAAFLGGCAGLSLTTTILPIVISTLGVTDDFSARLDLAGFAVYAFMLWAVGGWAAQKTGSTPAGGTILGLVGVISAAVFAGMSYGAAIELLMYTGAAGLAYGTLGGMIITAALAEPKGPDLD